MYLSYLVVLFYLTCLNLINGDGDMEIFTVEKTDEVLEMSDNIDP